MTFFTLLPSFAGHIAHEGLNESENDILLKIDSNLKQMFWSRKMGIYCVSNDAQHNSI